MLRAQCYTPGAGWRELADFSAVSDALRQDGNLLWGVADASDLDHDTMAEVAEEFSLHPLAVEDALNVRQRPKFEAYDSHMFVVFHQLDGVADQLKARQIACFVGPRYVLTVHDGAERVLAEASRRLHAPGGRPGHPSTILHALLDATVDEYQEIADDLEREVEELEEAVLADTQVPIQRRLYRLKQRLSRLRRYALPAQRVMDWVIKADVPKPFSARTAEYFRDIDDHLLRITDQIRNVDDLADAILNLQRAEQANALNEVTKRLTGWAAIIAVPTFIASVYGMNFELIPDEGHLFGFFFAIALMALSGLVLFAFFKRRGWI
jgi:magnesium transporter